MSSSLFKTLLFVASLASGLAHYGMVPHLLSVLTSPHLEPGDTLSILLALGHCTVASGKIAEQFAFIHHYCLSLGFLLIATIKQTLSITTVFSTVPPVKSATVFMLILSFICSCRGSPVPVSKPWRPACYYNPAYR